MPTSIPKLVKWIPVWVLLFPSHLLAAGGGKLDVMVIVADSRKFTGWRAWWTNLYNDSHLYFAVFTVLAIPLAGVILGSLADFVMARIGINLKSRVLREG